MTGAKNGTGVTRKDAEFVLITAAPTADCFKRPYPIISDVGPRIWVQATKEALEKEGVLLVSDGTQDHTDAFGTVIVSIPAEWCTFITEEQSNSFMAAFQERSEQDRDEAH